MSLRPEMKATEVHYKVPWRASGNFPGHHASQQQGGGLQFRNHAPLIKAPDPRRFDVNASLRDPFGDIQVRIYRQTSAIPVYVVADLSASMSFRGAHAKMKCLAEFVASVSYSAYRTGDRFGFVGCGDQSSEPWVVPATRHRAAGISLAEELQTLRPRGVNAEGLRHAAEFVGARRALIFLVSDFHFPLALLDEILSTLTFHDVVPAMIWDRHEFELLPRFGLARVNDPENNQSRLLLMRPSLRKRIEAEFSTRHSRLLDLFGRYGRLPLVLRDGFDADEVTHYFLG